MNTPEALALATAARLAHRIDRKGWARCRTRSPGRRELQCNLIRGHVGDHSLNDPDDPHFRWKGWNDAPPPTLAEVQAEVASGGDPERGPALSGRSADGRVEWSVNDFGVNIRVGMLYATRRAGSMEWDFGGHGTSACLVELGRLAEAADGGAR